MEALVPVALFDVPALGTPLTGIARVYLDHLAAGPGCLILELLAQIVESLTDSDIVVLGAHSLGGGAYTSQSL